MQSRQRSLYWIVARAHASVVGRLWSDSFMRSIDQEQFRWSAMVSPTTYVLAATVTLVAATVSALWVRRGLDRLDLTAVSKTRE